MRTALRVVLLLALLAGTVGAEPKPAFPLRWPAAEGWRTETIPFPLEFAPELGYAGVEELRFSPGFRKPGDPQYFTYAFVWVIAGAERIDAARLEGDLKQYFHGLMTAVARERKLSAKDIAAAVSLSANDDRFTGTVQTFDAFFTEKPLTLEVEVHEVPCKLPGKRVLYFNASPSLHQEATRKSLAEVEGRLACR
jgi:hypothetical protein